MAGWGLELDKRRVTVDSAMRASLPRVFAAGDLYTYPGKVPLISVGFGEVATAVNNAAPLVDSHMGSVPRALLRRDRRVVAPFPQGCRNAAPSAPTLVP